MWVFIAPSRPNHPKIPCIVTRVAFWESLCIFYATKLKENRELRGMRLLHLCIYNFFCSILRICIQNIRSKPFPSPPFGGGQRSKKMSIEWDTKQKQAKPKCMNRVQNKNTSVSRALSTGSVQKGSIHHLHFLFPAPFSLWRSFKLSLERKTGGMRRDMLGAYGLLFPQGPLLALPKAPFTRTSVDYITL